MTLRLRQICLVAPELEPAVAALRDVLGIEISHRDGAVGKYGLVNAVLPVGRCFLEVVAPTREGTAAGRYLERRGGAGGYMVILDCDDIAPWQARVAALGVRVANDLDYGGQYRGLQLHPRDTGGTLLEINWTPGGQSLDGPYHPAGPNWQSAMRTGVTEGLLGAEVQSENPAALAARWADILDRPLHHEPSGAARLDLDLGFVRFVAATDGRGEGLSGIDVLPADHAAIRAAAAARGVVVTEDMVALCGMRIRLAPERAA
jgi:hypothetical protein